MSDTFHKTPKEVQECMAEYDLVPMNPQATIFANKNTFPEKDACIVGRFVHYDAHYGATTYDGDPCGVLILELPPDADGRAVRMKLTLDKPQLQEAVYMAMVDLRWVSDVEQEPRTSYWMIVRYLGETEGKGGSKYKRFRVTTVVPK